MTKLSQAQRILDILKILAQSQKICTKSLQEYYGESERTIQRDIKLLREFLGESVISAERGCYQLISGSYFSDLLQEKHQAKALKSFFEFLTLMDSKSLQFLEEKEFSFLKQMKKESNEIYALFDNPIEELKKADFLEDLKLAIRDKRYCDIIYNEKASRELKDIQPQKILYAKNNWYLAAMTQNYKTNGGFKRFRINFIESLTLQPKTFHTDIQAQEHIKNMQSLFENFSHPKYEVQLLVDKEIARYFRVKKYLKSQNIVKEEEGSLILSFQINNDMEIIPLIRQWIPYITVISPCGLRQKLYDEISSYLKQL